MEIGKTKIEFLGFEIRSGQVILQNHVLSGFDKFPDEILDKTQLQRFLGFKIKKGQIILQNHVLSCFEKFPDEILDKT